MRFRLRTLLIATTWAGLIFLGLASPTPLWSGVVTLVTLQTMLVAILIVMWRKGTARAVAIGYLLFCGGYLVFVVAISST